MAFRRKHLNEAAGNSTARYQLHGVCVTKDHARGFCFCKSEIYSPADTPLLCIQEMKYIRNSLRNQALRWDSFDLTLLKYDPGHGGEWCKPLFLAPASGPGYFKLGCGALAPPPPLVGAANGRQNRGPRCCGRRVRVPSAWKEACPFVLSFLFLRRVCQRRERSIHDGGFHAKDRLTLERFVRVELLPSEAQVTLAGFSRQYLLNG